MPSNTKYWYALSVRPEKLEELGIVQSRNLARKGDEMGHYFCLQSLRKPSKERKKKQRLEVRQTSGFMDRDPATSVGISNPDREAEEQGIRESSE